MVVGQDPWKKSKINPDTSQNRAKFTSDPCPKLEFGDQLGHKFDSKGRPKPRALVHRGKGGGVGGCASINKKVHKANKM